MFSSLLQVSPTHISFFSSVGHSLMSADIDERAIGDRSSASRAKELVLLLAHKKADAILARIKSSNADTFASMQNRFLVTADQVIVCNGQVLEKPVDANEARCFLQQYCRHPCNTVGSIVVTDIKNGNRHEVCKSTHKSSRLMVEIFFCICRVRICQQFASKIFRTLLLKS
jgi:predicted house-cleaning NTP pyrophosphatase (Maf/HAM1 superfamily)